MQTPMAVKHLLYPRDPASTLSPRRRRTLQMGCQPFQRYAIVLTSLHMLKLEINVKTIFSNTQNFCRLCTLHALTLPLTAQYAVDSTGVQEVLYQEVIVLYCDWFTNIQQHITSYPGS